MTMALLGVCYSATGPAAMAVVVPLAAAMVPELALVLAGMMVVLGAAEERHR
jgi:hypothetical protein